MVNMVVSKSNLAHIQMTAGYVASLGITSFAATRASNPVAGSEFVSEVLDVNEFRMMLSELDIVSKKYGFRTDTIEANPPCAFGEDHIQRSHRYCGAGKNTCTIGYDGMVRACNRLPMTYGDITEGLSAAWSKMDDCRSDKNIPSECSACRLKTRCGGGCKADALVEYGDVKKPDPLCDFSYQPSPKASTLEPVTGTLFEINPKLQLRVEEFGAIAFISVSSWLAIDGRLLNLFTSGKEVIELSDIATVFSTTIESASKTAALLVKTHILIPID
jgi:radical SAM protein with 4Fe4S-binding SPASM domain